MTTAEPLYRVKAWGDFANQLANPDIDFIRAPAGRWILPSPLRIQRSVTIDFSGCTLVPGPRVYTPLSIGANADRDEKHATAHVDRYTKHLIATDATGVRVGQFHHVKIGVNRWDPNEAQYAAIRKVVDVSDNRIEYDVPFGIEATIYPSFEFLTKLSGYPDKVGPWGPVPGTYRRGLGEDHGYRIIHAPVENVNLIRPAISWTPGSRIYGSWAISTGYARGVRIVDAFVDNPRGSAVHFSWSEDCHVDGLTVWGVGHHAPYGPAEKLVGDVSAPVLTAWGAVGCSARRLDIKGRDLGLVDFEAGCRDMVVGPVAFQSRYTDGLRRACLFGVYGPSSVRFEDVSLDVPPISSLLFPAGLPDVVFRDLRIETDVLPDWFHWTGLRGEYEGFLYWGSRRFLPTEEIVFDFVADRDGFPIPYPEGIVLSASIEIQGPEGIRNITCPREVFRESRPKRTFPIYPEAFQGAIGSTYEGYRSVTLGTHKVWIERGAKVPIRVKCRVMREG